MCPEKNSGATRSKYFIKAIIDNPRVAECYVLTNTNRPNSIDGVQIESFGYQKPHGREALVIRIIRECINGIILVFKLKNKRMDFFYISSPAYFSALIVALFCGLTKRSFAFEVRDLYPESFVDAGLLSSNGFIYKLLKHLTKYIYKKSFLNIAVTKGMYDILSKFNHTCLSYNGYPNVFSQFPLKVKQKEFTVCIHGTFGVFQNVDLIGDIISAGVKEGVNFLVIGEGGTLKRIHSLAVANPNQVTVLNKQPLEELPNILAKCHLGLSIRDSSPLSQKSFPVRVWEYVGLGLPVVVSPADSEAGYFVSRNKIGSVSELSCEDVLNKILRYYYDHDEYLVCQSNILRIRDLYTREHFSKDLIDSSLHFYNLSKQG